NVPAYKERYDSHGVHHSDFKTLNDLELFPTIDKEFLRAAYPFNALAVPMDQIRRIHASSGTTGQPTTVAYTENDIEMWPHWLPAACALQESNPVIKYTTHTVTDCSPVAWAPITVQNVSAVRSSQCPAARPTNRCKCSPISN